MEDPLLIVLLLLQQADWQNQAIFEDQAFRDRVCSNEVSFDRHESHEREVGEFIRHELVEVHMEGDRIANGQFKLGRHSAINLHLALLEKDGREVQTNANFNLLG